MNYLVVKPDPSLSRKESFELTNTCNMPRLRVSDSYIPLTTAAGTNNKSICIKSDNTTYRNLYTTTSSFSQSASASATYITTANDAAGLSNVTNLTRVSTSNTVYHTRASTSAILTRASTYETLTRASTSATLTRASTYGSDYLTGWTERNGYYWLGVRYEGSVETTSVETTTWLDPRGWYRIYTVTCKLTLNGEPEFNAWGSFASTEGVGKVDGAFFGYNSFSRSSLARATFWVKNGIKSDFVGFSCGNNNETLTEVITYINAGGGDFQVLTTVRQSAITGTTYYTQASISGYATRESVYGYNTRQSVSGYATRQSTSETIYETRSSISGYKGISSSSSSSSESASGTCWR